MKNTALWLDKNEYPFESKYYEIEGCKLHYIDEGKGEVLLFVHGTPSWSFDFRHLIKRLSSSYRCIAIDHIGFGLSDKPHSYNYSTQRHSEVFRQFILDFELRDVTMFVHDFGGPIGMHVAVEMPHLFKRFVCFNTWLWSAKGDKDFEKLSKLLRSPLLPFLYKFLNFSVRYLLPKSFGDNKLDRRTHLQYLEPLKDRKDRQGTWAFALSLLNDQDWFESIWGRRQVLRDKQFLIVWGMKDKMISSKYLEKLKSGFENSFVLELATCGHFPQEEAHEEVLSFLDKHLGA